MKKEGIRHYSQPFIGFSSLASEFGLYYKTLKNMIQRDKMLVRQLKDYGFVIRKNKLPARMLSPNQANIIRNYLNGSGREMPLDK